jgi:hypothetical protein
MFFGQRIDRRGDPRGLETIVRFLADLCYDAVHASSGYKTAPALSRDIVVEQKVHAVLTTDWARLFSPRALHGGYFLVDRKA